MHQKTLFFTLILALTPVVLLAEPPHSTAKPMKYMVKSGDCLWNISGALLGDPLKWPMIYMANEGKIRDPNLIYPGQKFAIPPPLSITRTGLRKATQVAYTHMSQMREKEPAEKTTPVAREKSPPAPVAQAPEDAKAALPSSGETNPAMPASSTEKGPFGFIILVVLIVAMGGVFIWRKMASIPEESQEPRPLSSFPEVRNVTPMPDRTQEKEEPAEPPIRLGDITSVSMPSEPVASQPVGQAPPTAQAPAQPPVQPTGQEPPADKPGDSTPPPSSTHAA